MRVRLPEREAEEPFGGEVTSDGRELPLPEFLQAGDDRPDCDDEDGEPLDGTVRTGRFTAPVDRLPDARPVDELGGVMIGRVTEVAPAVGGLTARELADGGCGTVTGRPTFVAELVEGVGELPNRVPLVLEGNDRIPG